MPKLLKKNPHLKLVLTGGGYAEKYNFLVNVGTVPKQKLLNLISNSKMMIVPLEKGTGTRIKIIEAISWSKVLSTKKGIEGILIKKNDTVHIKKKQHFYQYLSKNLNKNYKNKVSKRFFKLYVMEKIVKEFLENKYVKNIFKTN